MDELKKLQAARDMCLEKAKSIPAPPDPLNLTPEEHASEVCREALKEEWEKLTGLISEILHALDGQGDY